MIIQYLEEHLAGYVDYDYDEELGWLDVSIGEGAFSEDVAFQLMLQAECDSYDEDAERYYFSDFYVSVWCDAWDY